MQVPSLTMAVALGVSEFLNSRKIPAKPKWPNDILVQNRKICGILSERVSRKEDCGIIIGIGLNINMTNEEANAIDRPATSMLIESGQPGSLNEILEELLPVLAPRITSWKNGGFAAIRNEWTEKAGPIGKPLSVHDANLKKRGTLAGFGPYGELLLQTEQGLETIWSGDIA